VSDDNGGSGNESGLVSSLRAENSRLNRELSKVTQSDKGRKETIRALLQGMGVGTKDEAQALINELRPLGGAIKLLEARKNYQPGVREKELESKLRTIVHDGGLKELYQDKALGLNPAVPVDKLKAIMGYAADTDEFDAAAARAKIQALRGTDPYLFASGDQAQVQGQMHQPGNVAGGPQWGGRGNSGTGQQQVEITDAQHRDVRFMLTQAPKLLGSKE
jgi:hypothetical protein